MGMNLKEQLNLEKVNNKMKTSTRFKWFKFLKKLKFTGAQIEKILIKIKRNENIQRSY